MVKKATKEKTKKEVAPSGQSIAVAIPPLKIKDLNVAVIGESPLITNCFSNKAKRQMLDIMTGADKAKTRPPKDPLAEFEAAFHKTLDGKPGITAVCFKHATVGACRGVDKFPMTYAKLFFHMIGDVLPVSVKESPVMREDWVRLKNGSTDLRYRPQFTNWLVKLHVRYDVDNISQEALMNLINRGGMGGVGERRPSKSGDSFGMYRVATPEEVADFDSNGGVPTIEEIVKEMPTMPGVDMTEEIPG